MWGSQFYILGTVLFSEVIMWLAYADFMMNMASWNQPIGDEFLCGGRRFRSFLGDEATLPQDTSLQGLGLLN
jgi:hypothetical protein